MTLRGGDLPDSHVGTRNRMHPVVRYSTTEGQNQRRVALSLRRAVDNKFLRLFVLPLPTRRISVKLVNINGHFVCKKRPK